MEYEREEEREATLHTFRSSFFVKQLRLNTGRNLETRGVSEGGGGGHCFLKWGFMRIFSGNQDATLKCMSELTF